MMHPTCILYWWCIPPASLTHDATNLHPELEIPIWVLLRLHKFILSYSIFTKQGKKLSWLETSTNYLPQRGGDVVKQRWLHPPLRKFKIFIKFKIFKGRLLRKADIIGELCYNSSKLSKLSCCKSFTNI